MCAWSLHHTYSFTVWTYPGGTVTHPPFIFFKAFFADHKATGTTPAELLLLFTAVTYVFADFFSPVTSANFLIFHCWVSP